MNRNKLVILLALIFALASTVCAYADEEASEEMVAPEAEETTEEAVEDLPIEEESTETADTVEETASEESEDALDEIVEEENINDVEATTGSPAISEGDVDDETEDISYADIIIKRAKNKAGSEIYIGDLKIPASEMEDLAAELSVMYEDFDFIEENGFIVAIVINPDDEEDEEDVGTKEPNKSSATSVANYDPVDEPRDVDSPLEIEAVTNPAELSARSIDTEESETAPFPIGNLIGYGLSLFLGALQIAKGGII